VSATLFDLLMEQIQPTVDLVARELAGLAEERVVAMLSKISIACQQTLSIAAADLEFDSGTDAAIPGVASLVDSALAVAPRKTATSRTYTPATYPPSRRAGHQPGQIQSNGKRAVTCQKCGFVGGNARGCGSAHETQSRITAATPDSDEKTARLGAIRARVGLPAPSASFDVDRETGDVRELEFEA
jgi:hypothetical protein